MVAIIAVLYSFQTVHLGVRWYWVRQAFIVNGDSRTAIFESFLNQDYQWMWAVSGVFASLNILIADCVLVRPRFPTRALHFSHRRQIWRAWVVWDRNYKIVVVPIIGAILEISKFPNTVRPPLGRTHLVHYSFRRILSVSRHRPYFQHFIEQLGTRRCRLGHCILHHVADHHRSFHLPCGIPNCHNGTWR